MAEIKYQEGDIFAISLAADENEIKKFSPPYAFGRLIAINPSKDMIVEIFKHIGKTTDKKDVEDAIHSNRLFDAVDVLNYRSKNRWRLVKRDETYKREDSKFSEVRFDMGSLVWEAGKTREMRNDEMGKYEKMILHAPVQVERKIKSAHEI